jgi:hypothetical protein
MRLLIFMHQIVERDVKLKRAVRMLGAYLHPAPVWSKPMLHLETAAFAIDFAPRGITGVTCVVISPRLGAHGHGRTAWHTVAGRVHPLRNVIAAP